MARTSKTAIELIDELRRAGTSENLAGMGRFGIETSSALGVSMPQIRRIAATAKRDHQLASSLWASGLHEARILAALVEEPYRVTRKQMDAWVADLNSWDLCDQVTGNLFDRLDCANEAIADWREDKREFVKRAAFTMIAWRAVHLKKEPHKNYLPYLEMIEEAADDNRNFVRKAVNWALRQIGKRHRSLHGPALDLAHKLEASNIKSAQWIGRDAVRELESTRVLEKLAIATD